MEHSHSVFGVPRPGSGDPEVHAGSEHRGTARRPVSVDERSIGGGLPGWVA